MPKPDLCMFCSCSPCECNVRKKVARPKVEKKPAVEKSVVPPPSSALEAMKRAALRPPITSAPAQPKIVYQRQTEQSDLIEAIKTVKAILGGVLTDPDDEKVFAAVLKEPNSPTLRAYLWRSRREESRGDHQDGRNNP